MALEFLSRLAGTLNSYFRVNSVRLKDNSGVLDIRNTADSAYADLHAKVGNFAALTDYWRRSVEAVAVSNISVATAPAAVDGVTLSSGHRILLTNQSAPAENGLWVFASAGAALSRPADYAAASAILALTDIVVYVRNGTSTYKGTFWKLDTTGAITIDSTTTAWTQVLINSSGLIGVVFDERLFWLGF